MIQQFSRWTPQSVHFNFIVRTRSFRHGILPRYQLTCAISSIIRLPRNLASYYAGMKGTRRRESKNVGIHDGVNPPREREGRSEARDRHGRKLVSFVKFLERKVPFGFPVPRHLSRTRVSDLPSTLPYSTLSRPDRNLSRMAQEFTTKVFARTWPLLYTARPPIWPIVIYRLNYP